MNGFLIDTNVLSEYNRPGGPNAGVKQWLETTARELQYVSVITLAEIQKGIELLDERKRRTQLEQWLTQDLETWFSGRVLLCGSSGIAPLGVARGARSAARKAASHS